MALPSLPAVLHSVLPAARMIKYDHACQVDLMTIGSIFTSMWGHQGTELCDSGIGQNPMKSTMGPGCPPQKWKEISIDEVGGQWSISTKCWVLSSPSSSEIVRSDNLRLISELSRLFYWVCRKSQARLVGLVDSWLVIQCGAHKGLYQATGDTMGNTTIWYDEFWEPSEAFRSSNSYWYRWWLYHINIHHRVMDEPLLQLRQDLFATLVESAGGNMEGTPQCGLFSVWCHVASVCCSVQFIDLCIVITCILSHPSRD